MEFAAEIVLPFRCQDTIASSVGNDPRGILGRQVEAGTSELRGAMEVSAGALVRVGAWGWEETQPGPGALSDSTDDNGEATFCTKCSGDPVRDLCCLRQQEWVIVENLAYSSADDTGDDKPGDGI